MNRRDFSPVWLVLLAGTAVTLLAALVVLGPWKDRAPAFLHFPVVLHLLTGLAFVLALASLLFLAWRMGHAARSEVALVELLEQVSEGLMLVDGRGRIVSVNQELQRIFGLGLSELDGQPVQNLLPGWSPEKHHNRGAVNGESRPVLGEFVGKSRDGAERLVEVRRGPVLQSRQGSLTALLVRDMTQARKTEMLVRTQDLHLRLMLQQMPGILWTTDDKLQITSSVGAGLAELALNPRELIGMSMMEYLDKDSPECTAIAAHQAALRGQSLNYEMTWKERCFQVRVDPLREGPRRIIGTIGVMVDVTESRETVAELRARARQQAAVATLGHRALAGLAVEDLLREAATLVCQTLDVEFCKVVEALPGGAGLRLRAGAGWKVRPSEPVFLPGGADSEVGYALQRNEPVLVEDLSAEKRFRASPLLRQYGVAAGITVVIPGKDRPFGTLGAHTARLRRFKKDDLHFLQAVAHILASVLDRQRAEEARQRLVAILEATTDVVAMADAQHRLLYVNQAGRRLLGLRPDEDLERRSLAAFYPQEMRQRFLNEELSRARQGGVHSGETCLRNSHGRDVLVSQVILVHRGPAGDVEFYSFIARDLSERQRLEEQLRQAQKMEAVGRLAGGVAHDFNNLLTIINGYSEILEAAVPAGDARFGYVQEVKKAGERAAGLTRQLLAFSRKQVMVPQVLNLNERVTEMEKMLRRLIGEDVELSLQLETRLRPIKADPGQIEQVLMNLVVNARDAMPKGGKLLIATRNVQLKEEQLRDHPEVLPGPYVQLQVQDNGCGMDEQTVKHLFEPFFTTKEPGKGTGLGLATVYGIVKQSDGHLEVVSSPGKGTTFSIYLPRLEAVAETGSKEVKPVALPRGTETVLLVEDEEGVRTLARQVLRQSGYTVLEAGNGEEALALSDRHAGPIHLLLSDVVMPKMSGNDLSLHLRESRPDIRVLFMSGFNDTALLRYEIMSGEAECLQKPFTPQTMACKVREVLDRAPGATSPSLLAFQQGVGH